MKLEDQEMPSESAKIIGQQIKYKRDIIKMSTQNKHISTKMCSCLDMLLWVLFCLIIPGVCLAQFSLNNAHKRGLKHHHFICYEYYTNHYIL